MSEEYQKFLDFDWSDEGWQAYLNGLYPVPIGKQVLKFKKKWYKRNVDPDFDETYDPNPPTPSTSSNTAESGENDNTSGPSISQAFHDGAKWAVLGPKATICFMAYTVSLTLAVGAMAYVFPPYEALVVLQCAFILELLAKYGVKLSTECLCSVLVDDVGVMPIMSLTLLMPGLSHSVRIFALVPAFLTAVMSFAQICRMHTKPRVVPTFIREFFLPLTEVSARYQVMQIRAHMEVALGVVLLAAVFAMRAAPISMLLYWNFMMMRYMMSPWMQTTFQKIDGVLSASLGRIPVIKLLYAAAKRKLYSFVDPKSSRGGTAICTIL